MSWCSLSWRLWPRVLCRGHPRPGTAPCLCLDGTMMDGVCCSIACGTKPNYSGTSPLCCHCPQVCLFITPAVRGAAWARGVIDLFTRRFPCGRRVVARTFIFHRSRWQPGCMCVTALPPPRDGSASPGLGERDANPSPWDSLPAHVLLHFLFSFKEKMR